LVTSCISAPLPATKLSLFLDFSMKRRDGDPEHILRVGAQLPA
jgi:hypothetical protein